MLLSDRDQKELINCIVGPLLQRIDKDWNYVWDMILTICEYASHCMDIVVKYYRIVEVLYIWSQSELSKTNMFHDFYT